MQGVKGSNEEVATVNTSAIDAIISIYQINTENWHMFFQTHIGKNQGVYQSTPVTGH